MISISGVRGVIGETMTPDLITKMVAAFAHITGHGKVVLGRDSRPSGEFVKHIAKGTLLASGCEVVDLDIVPTPTVQLITEILGADAGLVITASHNPVEWNGLKFIDSDGLFFPPEKAEQLFELAEAGGFQTVPVESLGKTVVKDNAVEEHINRILKLDYIDVNALKKKKFKVVVDTVWSRWHYNS